MFRPSVPFSLAALLMGLSELPAQHLLKDLAWATSSSATGGYCRVADQLAFRGRTGLHGQEIWFSDGSPAGTQSLDLNPGPASGMLSSAPASLGAHALFVGDNGTDTGLFRADAQPRALTHISFLRVDSRASVAWTELSVHAGDAYLLADDGLGRLALYRSDGSPQGTRQLQSFAGQRAGEIWPAAGRLYFTVFRTAAHELWVSDGTSGGTVMLRSSSASLHEHGVGVGDLLYFVDTKNPAGPSLWKSDGSSAGTQRVIGIQGSVVDVCALRHLAIVAVVAADFSAELWRIDPGAVPQRYAIVHPASSGPQPSLSLISDPDADRIFVRVGGTRPTLFSSGGSPASTLAFHQAVRLSGWGIRVHGNQLFYGVLDGAGTEPWISDGSVQGTRQIVDLAPGPASSNPYGFTVIPDLPAGPQLLFHASDPTHGAEPRMMPLRESGAAVFDAWRPGCPAAAGALQLGAQGGEARLGNAGFGLFLRSPYPNALVAFVLDPAPGLQVAGCGLVWPQVFLQLGRSDGFGQAGIALPIPQQPSVLGVRVYAQALVEVPGGPALGIAAASPTRLIVVGR